MSGNFNDLEITTRKSAFIQERMNEVTSHMYKQFLEYQQSNANTAIMFDKMVENMALTVEYLKQSFASRGVPTENIYYKYDKAHYIAVMNILWHTITFYSNMKDTPKALSREKDAPIYTGRIYALRGTLPELAQGFSDDMQQKLLDAEIASIYIPADKTGRAIIKMPHSGNQEFYINQMEAPRDFLLGVIENVCRVGNKHAEGSRYTINI